MRAPLGVLLGELAHHLEVLALGARLCAREGGAGEKGCVRGQGFESGLCSATLLSAAARTHGRTATQVRWWWTPRPAHLCPLA